MARILWALASLLLIDCAGAFAQEHVQELRLPANKLDEVRIEIQIDGQNRSLELRRHSFRAFDFSLLEDRGGKLHRIEAPEPQTFIGEISGVPGSRVGASFSDEGMRAFLLDPDSGIWVVEPQSSTLHRSYRLGTMASSPGTCGLDDSSPELGDRSVAPDGSVSDPGAMDPDSQDPGSLDPGGDALIGLAAAGPKSAELAFDADYELYEIHGFSSWAVLQEIETILVGVNTIYESQFELTHTVSAVIVRTAEEDPYSYVSADFLLGQMRDHWNAQHLEIRADLVHLMTGRDIFGTTVGIAYVGATCNPYNRYGLSQTHYDTDLGNRVALTAHELGHNWSATHCDGEADCNIMCSAIGACNPVIDSFGSSAVDSISTFLMEADCLLPAYPEVVYVDGSYTGASSGSFGHPFTSVGNGVSGLTSGGLLVIRSGSYGETLMLYRPMLLTTYRGNSLIGP